ncbi:hypothetical protein [Streptomyces otsuchiensis]|uniref:hypothetical protein n=1 Tax=Streptomyces otsuchiensis TaxID=2681388 RepID=UPI001030D2ED|nr:hypothetical protein [Streptomyces otsuchiensis]
MSGPRDAGPGNSSPEPGPDSDPEWEPEREQERAAVKLPPGQVTMHGSAHDGARVFQAINMYIYESGSRPERTADEALAERVVSLARKTRIGGSFRVTPYLHRPMIETYVARHGMDDGEQILASFGSDPKTENAVPNPGARRRDPLRGPAYVIVTTTGVRWVNAEECGILRYTDSWDAEEYHRRLPSVDGKGLYWPKTHGLRFAFDEQAVWLVCSAHWWQKCRDVSVLAQFLTSVREIARI